MQKVKKAACSYTPQSTKLAKNILFMFRILFINGFIDRHGTWLKVKVEPTVSHYLYNLIENNLKTDTTSPGFNIKDMEFISLEKNLNCDPTFNMATMMSDKALSLQKTDLIQTYKRTKGIGKAERRRVLLE